MRAGILVVTILAGGCQASPVEQCRSYARALDLLAMRCPGSPVLDPLQCEAVVGVRDPASFDGECIQQLESLECLQPLPEACNGQLRR